MPALTPAQLPAELQPTGTWVVTVLHALARDEVAGRRSPRITEPKLDTWSRFRGRLTVTDFVALLFEDAAVVHGIPFDADALGGPLRLERLPETVLEGWMRAILAMDLVHDAARSRGFRMLVTPPELHADIGRSVAMALGGTWLSFEDAFFTDHEAEMPSLERAERFVAQRGALTEAAESTLFRLLEEYGEPGKTLVLGDTALLELCDAVDLPRRLYDETLSGNRGFWILVLPGVIHNRQPRFNEGPPMWYLEGATLPLLGPLSGGDP